MLKKFCLGVALFVAAGAQAFAQDFKNEFGFQSDNDAYLFYGQDRYYTNGLFINFRHVTDQQKLKKLEKLIYEVTVGQKMYNPISGQRPDPNTHDRPFAGYLYGGGKVSFFHKNESIVKAGLEIGTIGPRALGRQAQELLHKIVGFYKIEGWEYQIRNELAVNLSAQYTKLLYRNAQNKLDFSFDGYANLGTTFSGAGAGILFRTGKLNQLFNTAAMNASISNNGGTKKLVREEFFFYAKPMLNVVAYDATIQGGMFNDDSPVTFGKKSLVFAQQLGLNYSTPRFTLDYSLMFRSKEVKSTAKAHQYGALSMYYRFGGKSPNKN